jgi:hypothetical protein
MKPYGTLGSEFLKANSAAEESCDLCDAHVQAQTALPDEVACPHCGAALDVYNITAMAAVDGLTVVSETNRKSETQRFTKLPVDRCSKCNEYIALRPIPVIYNANHDIYYTGGVSYLSS